MLDTKKSKIGVWLRPQSNPDLYEQIKKIGRVKRNETVERVIVKDIRLNGQVQEALIEVWLSKMTFRKVFRVLFGLPYEAERLTVFIFWEKENDNWICEGDLGTGLKDF